MAEGWESAPDAPILRQRRAGEVGVAVIDVRAIFQTTFDQMAYKKMPSLLKPIKGPLGLQDYEKVFCLDHKGLGDIYEMRGIDRTRGCMIVVRPDQYIAHVLPLDAYDDLSAFFAAILRTV